MLSKKSFAGIYENFLKLLMRSMRGDARDHIASQKNDHGLSYRHYKASQRRSSPKITICEIFGVVRFSTFSTASVKLRRTQCEHMISALPSNSDIPRRSRHVSSGPGTEVKRRALTAVPSRLTVLGARSASDTSVKRLALTISDFAVWCANPPNGFVRRELQRHNRRRVLS